MERDAAKKAAVGHLREERLDKMKEEQKRIFLNHEAELKELRAQVAQARRELRAVQKERDDLFLQDRVKTCQLEDMRAELRELGQCAPRAAPARVSVRAVERATAACHCRLPLPPATAALRRARAPLTHSAHPPLAHSHTHTLAHSHTHTLAHSHTHTLAHSHTHTLAHSHTRPLTALVRTTR